MLILTSNHNKVQIYATINVELSVATDEEEELDSVGPSRMTNASCVALCYA